MKLPRYVTLAIELLENSGFQAVVVGGAVRDYLLGLTPNDYDISTDALPEEIKEVFMNYFTLDTGIKHGTITVFINHQQLEITTFRREEAYDDYRHPNKVIFEDNLQADALRRDFTINAICYNKQLIDLVGGISDLNNQIIRAIGNPHQRFMEDPLRILRAMRFAATLSFTIEDETKESMFTNVDLLSKISQERINLEFSKLLLGTKAKDVVEEYQIIIKKVIPTFVIHHHLKALNYLDNNLSLRLVVFFIKNTYNELYHSLKNLKYSNKLIKEVLFYHENYHLSLEDDEKALLKMFKKYQYLELQNIILIQLGLAKAQDNNEEMERLSMIQAKVKKIYQKYDCFQIQDLKISGKDLIKLGFSEGVTIRLILDKLLDEVLATNIKNNRQELINYTKQNFLHQNK